MQDHFLRRHFEKLISLTDDEFDYILSHFSSRKLKKHQFVVQTGEPVVFDYFVTDGCLKSYFQNQDGKMHILQFGMPDWWITDYQAYHNETKATIDIDCVENSSVLCLSLENREKLCREMHKVEHFFRKKTNRGYVALQQRILSMLRNDVKTRYEELLVMYPDLSQKVPKQLIAAYLGVSRETLSRLSD